MSKRNIAWVIGCLALFMLWQLVSPERPTPPPVTPVVENQAAGPAIPDTLERAPGELVLDARQADWDALQEDLHQIAPQATVEKVSRFDDEMMVTLQLPDDQVDSTVAALQKDSHVEDAQPDYIMHAYNAPDDPLYKYQWNMKKVGAEKAWQITAGKGVTVAVIDTGVAYEEYGDRFHLCEDFKSDTFVPGYNFCNNSSHPNDDHAHGTHVAGTIAEATHNGIGAVGLAYEAKIMPIKVLAANGGGTIGNIADGIRWSVDHGADVINMSLGGPFGPPALRKACEYAARKKVVVVCAAGNSKSTNVGYPAAYPMCIAVSSVRDDNTLAFYSNRGKRIDIAAPGGDTTVDQNEDGYPDGILQNTIAVMNPTKQGYFLFQGTSMASPHVAAAAALLESLGVNQPETIRQALKDTAYKKNLDLEQGYGGGILQADALVRHEVLGSGTMRLVIGVLLVALIGVVLQGRGASVPGIGTALGLMLGASGFFFLPFITNKPIPFSEFICRPMPLWDIALLGLHQHANPLFYSCLVPLGLCLVLNGLSRLTQRFVVGISAGFAACLLQAVLTESVVVRWVPSALHLDTIWLVANAAACMLLAVSMAEQVKPVVAQAPAPPVPQQTPET